MSGSTTQTNAERLIGKWFLGTDLPIPTSNDDNENAVDIPDLYSVATGSLFVNGISASDVNQGNLGTCYLLSSLGAIANVNSTWIKDCFIDNGNDTYGVRFYNQGKAVYTTVDKRLPVMKDTNLLAFAGDDTHSPSSELWVALLEKAYIGFNTQVENRKNIGNSYTAVAGGLADPIKQITGLDFTEYNYENTRTTLSVGSDGTGYTGLGLMSVSSEAKTAPTLDKQTLINALSTGSIGWLGSFIAKTVPPTYTYGGNGAINFVGGHAYMLLGYNNASDTFTVRNPWGDSGTSYGNYQVNPEFQVRFEDFWNPTVHPKVVLSSPANLNSSFKYAITSSASSTPVIEGNAVTFTVTRSGTGSASSAYLSTFDGTTTSSDYAAFNKSALTFAANETAKTFTVGTNKDTLTEGTEKFWVNLYTATTDTTATTSIYSYIQDAPIDNYTYSIDSSATTAPAIEGSPVTFTVTRSGTGSASSVYVSTDNGSATGKSDYALLNKVAINFAANETSKTVTMVLPNVKTKNPKK
jgi:hypothetical protein